MNSFTYTIDFDIKDNKITGSINNITGGFSGLDDTVKGVGKGVSDFAKGVNNQLKSIQLSAIIDQVKNVSESINGLTGTGISFEQSMADMSSITGITGKDLDDLGATARKVGKDTGVGAGEAAEAYKILASQIDVSTIGMRGLQSLQKETITLAQAGGNSMGESATALAGTINQFGLAATEANRVINVLAAGAKYGAAEIPDLTESLKVTGAVAKTAGLSIEQTAGAIEVLSKNNMKGSEAGTALRNIITKLQTELKVDLTKTSLSSALEGLKPKLQDVTFLAKTFGAENLAAAQFLITNAGAVDQMTRSVTGTNTAQEQAAIRTNTTAEKMKRLQANIDDAKIAFAGIMGASAGYIAVGSQQLVLVSQMLPIFTGVGKAISIFTDATKLHTLASGIASTATTVWTTVQTGLNAAFIASPIGWIVVGVGALAAGVVYAWNKFEGFRQAVLGVWEVMKEFGRTLVNGIIGAFKSLLSGVGSFGDAFIQLLDGNFSKAVDLAKKGARDIGSAMLGLNPIGAVGSAIANGNYKGAWENGKAQGSKSWNEDKKETTKTTKQSNTVVVAPTPNIPTVTSPYQYDFGKDKNKSSLPAYHKTEKIAAPNIAKLPDYTVPKETLDSWMKLDENIHNVTSSTVEAVDPWQGFKDMLDQMIDPMANVVEGLTNIYQSLISQMAQGAESLSQFGQQIKSVIRDTIGSVIAEGVAFMVANALKNAAFLGPLAPIAAPVLAAAAAGLAKSAFNTLVPKFAEGGVVYGNTIAQVGEYPGASNNPEVIAPLSKLRNLLQPSGVLSGNVEFVIQGDKLVGILNKQAAKNRYF